MPDDDSRYARERAAWRQRMLVYVDALHDAVHHRDASAVQALLTRADAAHLPREVREEVIAVAGEGVESLRAPIRLLRFGFVLTQLDPADAAVADRRTATQLRLDLGLDPAEAPGRGAIRWREETAAARLTRDDDGRP